VIVMDKVETLIWVMQHGSSYDQAKARKRLKEMGGPAVEHLTKLLKDESYMVRADMAKLLGEIGDKKAVEPLIPLLKDPDWLVRQNVVWALGNLKDERAVEPLIGALKDKTWNVRSFAASALGRIGDARAVGPLVEIVKGGASAQGDDGLRVLGVVVYALGEIGDKRAVEPLLEASKAEDADVRVHAFAALGGLGDTRAIEPLIGMLNDPDADVRRTAARGLIEAGEPAVKPLVEASKKPECSHLRREISGVLAQINENAKKKPHDFGVRDTEKIRKPMVPKEFQNAMLDAKPVKLKL